MNELTVKRKIKHSLIPYSPNFSEITVLNEIILP